MEENKTLYHAGKKDRATFKRDFIIRHREFDKITGALLNQSGRSLQHFVITGKRGMGKSTLLRRVFIEAEENPALNSKILPVLLIEEQYRLSRLFKLWEKVIDSLQPAFPQLAGSMQALKESNDYEKNLIYLVTDLLQQTGKTLLLLVDNFDQFIAKIPLLDQHALREALIQYPVQIIGNSVFYNEPFIEYSQPFYDFFRPIHLQTLNKIEAEAFIREKAVLNGIDNFEELYREKKGKITALRILSGGVPRTLIILLRIVSTKTTGETIDYLEEMLEVVTPLYQDRMKSLSPLHQEIICHLAMRWDRTSLKEIAGDMRVKSNNISAQLAKLAKAGYINQVSSGGRNHYYEIDERFFNIWLLMSEAPAHDARRVKWLTKSLDMIYEQPELEDFARFQLGCMSDGYHYKNFLMAQAMAASEKLSPELKEKIVLKAEENLKDRVEGVNEWLNTFKNNSGDVNERERQLIEEIGKEIDNNNYSRAEQLLRQLEKTNPIQANFGIGFFYQQQQQYDTAVAYYLMAVEKGDVKAMNNLAWLYENVKQDYDGAEQYYHMAVDKGCGYAMYNLAILYSEVRQDYHRAEQYYLMAVDKGIAAALNNLAWLYEKKKRDYDKAEQYYLMAVDKGDIRGMNNLANLHFEVKQDYDKAEQYYLMAVEKGDAGSMFNLALLYQNVKQDYFKAEKYYLMAVDKGNADAMFNLAEFYRTDKQDYDKAEQYYLMAVDKGETRAMNNLANLHNEVKQDYDKAEQYYLMAVNKGDADAINNLGWLYKNVKQDYDKAEQYYLEAVEKGHAGAMHNLALLYFKSVPEKKTKALQLSEHSIQQPYVKSITFNIVLLLWNEQYPLAVERTLVVLNDKRNADSQFLLSTLKYFLVFKQRHSLLKIFNLPELELKDRHKPLYYALLHEMQEEYPKEYLKMPAELEEPVMDILAFVNKERERLAVRVQ